MTEKKETSRSDRTVWGGSATFEGAVEDAWKSEKTPEPRVSPFGGEHIFRKGLENLPSARRRRRKKAVALKLSGFALDEKPLMENKGIAKSRRMHTQVYSRGLGGRPG